MRLKGKNIGNMKLFPFEDKIMTKLCSIYICSCTSKFYLSM